MSLPCVNGGGPGSLIRLEASPVLEKELALSPKAIRALAFWQARPGQIVTVQDPAGRYLRARVTSFAKAEARVVPFHHLPVSVESPLQITVFQALPEKERFELVLQKLTEIGVQRIVPFHSQRSTTLQKRDSLQKKSHRWPEVLLRAARQCRRAIIPELSPVVEWPQVLSEMKVAQAALLLYEKEGGQWLGQLARLESVNSLALIIGPEGGFNNSEVVAAQAQGAIALSLGPRILRTETAAIVAASACQTLWGDLGKYL